MTADRTPLVSVVIPTINRPQLLVRAVASALAQTLEEIEVVTVVDGPDEETTGTLARIDDPRLRVVQLERNIGLGGAINAGARAARGEWIALLDDDDVWMPPKLEAQLSTAQRSRYSSPIISCRAIMRTDHGDFVRPRRSPAEGEPLCEYLFSQRSLTMGDSLLLPSTLFITRSLLLRVPCREGLVVHNDVDWLLRATKLPGVGVELVTGLEPFVVWDMSSARPRISTSVRFTDSLSWARANRGLLTERAYASFLLSWVSLLARKDGGAKAFWALLVEASRDGRPRLLDLLAHLSIWLVPRHARAMATRVLDRFRTPFRSTCGPCNPRRWRSP